MTTEERKKIEEWAARRSDSRPSADKSLQDTAEELTADSEKKIELDILSWAKNNSITIKNNKS